MPCGLSFSESSSTTTKQSILVGFALTMLVSLGCSSGKPNHSPVEGTVTLDGQPLAEGTVQFFPEATEGQTAGAVIKAGHYQLESSPGSMRVVIKSPKAVSQRKAYDDPNSPMIEQIQEQLPARYSTEASELRAKVEQGKENKIDFPLTSEGEKPKPSVFQ